MAREKVDKKCLNGKCKNKGKVVNTAAEYCRECGWKLYNTNVG